MAWGVADEAREALKKRLSAAPPQLAAGNNLQQLVIVLKNNGLGVLPNEATISATTSSGDKPVNAKRSSAKRKQPDTGQLKLL